MVERGLGIGIFDPALGGDPVLFQHLFWFYSHPAVYIMILPGFGVISEIIACFLTQADLRLRLHRLLQPGHRGDRLLRVGSPHVREQPVGLCRADLLLPDSIWWPSPPPSKSSTGPPPLYRDRFRSRPPCSTPSASSGLFTVGGLTGLFLASLATDVHLHDTYFVVAHFHYVMVGGMVMAFLGGLHFWWPKMTGRMYPETLGQVRGHRHFHRLQPHLLPPVHRGLPGYAAPLPRVSRGVPGPAAHVHCRGQRARRPACCWCSCYLPWSLIRGKKAPANPWNARGLEWDIPSPPPMENFAEIPVVTGEAYAYDQD